MATQPLESDLWIPKPADGETWPDHTIHTHYFGFSIPEATPPIGVFIYIRLQPVYNLSSGGAMVFRGLENTKPLDVEHCNYINTLPYPEFKTTDEGTNILEIKNGLTVEFLEVGKKMRITYNGKDGTTFDVTQEALTPLLVRGHVFPNEDAHHDPSRAPGGSEQFMSCVGSLTLHGEKYEVNCTPIRDRSWRQVRVEDEVPYPPVAWSPMYFGPHLSFNQVGFDSTQVWADAFSIDKSKPTHYFAWVLVDGVKREVVRVNRQITKWHPSLYAATAQTIEAEDDQGTIYRFKGEAVAQANLPSWPNGIFVDSVYKWTNEETGEVCHATYQEAWFAKYQRFMKGRIAENGSLVKKD